MKPASQPALDVVLVRPRNPLNIGSVARAMANFGLEHLSVVDAYEPHWREARTAVDAEDLLQSARALPTLAEAVAQATLVIGTGSLTYRKPEQEVVQLPELAPRVRRELASGGQIALVFGPEKHGLTREDLSWCHILVEIPTSPRQPSMNLAQAVAVSLYELSTRALANPWTNALAAQPAPTSEPAREPAQETVPESALQSPELVAPDSPSADATSGSATPAAKPASSELDRLANLIEEAMAAARYSPAHMRPANQHDLRLMLRRLQFNTHDLRRALGLFRRILWRIGRQ